MSDCFSYSKEIKVSCFVTLNKLHRATVSSTKVYLANEAANFLLHHVVTVTKVSSFISFNRFHQPTLVRGGVENANFWWNFSKMLVSDGGNNFTANVQHICSKQFFCTCASSSIITARAESRVSRLPVDMLMGRGRLSITFTRNSNATLQYVQMNVRVLLWINRKTTNSGNLQPGMLTIAFRVEGRLFQNANEKAKMMRFHCRR